jgi:hypothetical protein
LGAVIGFVFGLFVVVPWGPFATVQAPGLWLALPLVVASTLVGGWFGTAINLTTIESRAPQHQRQVEGSNVNQQAFEDVRVSS